MILTARVLIRTTLCLLQNHILRGVPFSQISCLYQHIWQFDFLAFKGSRMRLEETDYDNNI